MRRPALQHCPCHISYVVCGSQTRRNPPLNDHINTSRPRLPLICSPPSQTPAQLDMERKWEQKGFRTYFFSSRWILCFRVDLEYHGNNWVLGGLLEGRLFISVHMFDMEEIGGSPPIYIAVFTLLWTDMGLR